MVLVNPRCMVIQQDDLYTCPCVFFVEYTKLLIKETFYIPIIPKAC